MCFPDRTFQFKVDQCYPIFRCSWNFCEMFSLISFLKNFSRMKRWWRKELQLPATIKRSFLSSYKGKKLFERHRQLRLLPKQTLCQSYFTFQIIFTKQWRFSNSSKCFPDGNVWPPGQWPETREKVGAESLQKIRTKPYEVAGHVWIGLKL